MNKAPFVISAALLAAAPLLIGFAPEKPTPVKVVKGVQTITITVAEGKYTPSHISAAKGKPLAITFKGGKGIGCGSVVEIKSENKKVTVKDGASATIKFTPAKAGEIEFACPMRMYLGTITVK